MSLYNELKRRNVLRVGAAYIVASWLIIQVVETIFPAFGFGDSAIRIVVIVLAIAFIPGLILSWVFEITPEGMKREVDVVRDDSTTYVTGKRLDRIIMVLLALALGYFAFDKFVLDPVRDDLIIETAHQEGRSEALVESFGDKSIAVLAFVNMSDDAGNEYFSDGISEEILNLLAKIPELRVISRSSAFSFKGRGTQIPEIAKILNVAHILEGSVRKVGNQVRITAQLIDARTDTHLWSETYDRELANIFAVQDEIAREIASKLQAALVDPAQTAQPTESEEAYDKFLRGWHFIRQGWAPEDFLKAEEYFKAAIEIDPQYAQAYALLAVTYNAMANLLFATPVDVLAQALEAAETALALDDRLPEAWYARGWVAISYEFDWRNAEKMFLRGIELAPSNYLGYQGLTFAMTMAGRYDEALAAARQAFALDPMTIWTRSTLLEVTYRRREYDDALEHALAILEMQPDDSLMTGFLGWLYILKDMPEEALRYAGEAIDLADGNPNLELNAAVVYANLGMISKATEILDRAEEQNTNQLVSPGYMAVVYAALGESDQAFAWLDLAIDYRDSFVFCLDYPAWDPLRSDPRFVEMCKRFGMACAEPFEG
jgi:TolB-like protein/Flp pilus assembly protein TadD